MSSRTSSVPPKQKGGRDLCSVSPNGDTHGPGRKGMGMGIRIPMIEQLPIWSVARQGAMERGQVEEEMRTPYKEGTGGFRLDCPYRGLGFGN